MRRYWAGRGQAAVAAIAAAAAACACTAAGAGEARRHRPAGDAIVLVLPAGLVPGPTAADDPSRAAARAESLLALARETQDARHFGRAEALVAPWVARPDAPPRLLVASADLAQQRHDFARARGLLDAALAREPRNAGALLARANVSLLLGEHAAARRDCTSAMQAGAGPAATVCLASSLTGPGSAARARRLLESLEAATRAAPAIAEWRLLTLADAERRDGDLGAAVRTLSRARALAPAREETRALLADALLASGEPAAALSLTEGSDASVAFLVTRIRAASATGTARASGARRAFDDLLDVGCRRGGAPHLRELGELALYVDGDAGRALALARRNFAAQKDTPDLRLYADAAIAAGDRDAVESLRRWLAETGFEDRVVAARLAEAAP
jgi:tetratricopeptide (TPR) repeat protein